MANRLNRHYVFAVVAPVFWSLAGVIVKSLEHATEWQINFYRCGSLALFVALVILIRYRRSTGAVMRAGGFKALFSGVLLSGAMLCNVVALKYTTVAVAVLVMAAAPIFAAILGSIFLGESVNTRVRVSIVLAFVGITIMVGGSLQLGDTLGVTVAILGILFFGAYTVSLRVGKSADMTPAVFYGGVIGALIAMGMSFASGVGLTVPLVEALWCVLLGVVQLGVGSVLFALAAQSVPAVQLTIFALGEPLLAPLWAWIGVGEVPTWATLAGGAVLFSALGLQVSARRD
ncbi:MAG: DMT family transporter [Proteobacteria bacterium]|nr:DMT family transporter [Pseudomonadota bacterium]